VQERHKPIDIIVYSTREFGRNKIPTGLYYIKGLLNVQSNNEKVFFVI
jgi:hypothetical protein